ncbi:MAG TPA: hypothetical protein VF275_03215 [Gammaproteobacteria bacterium]
MNKTFWIGFVVVYVVGYAVNFLIHGVLLDGTYTALADLWRPEQEMMDLMWIMFLTSIVFVFAFCYIYTKGHEGKGIMEGVRYGLLMGLFTSTPMAFDSFVMYPVSFNLALIWFVTGIVQWIIAGAIFASIYKPGK